MKIKAAIFDMDGVITKTRDLHISSFRHLFADYLKESDAKDKSELTDEQYSSIIDGKPRYDGVQAFLESRGIKLEKGDPKEEAWKKGKKATICSLGNTKDIYFHKILDTDGVSLYDSTITLIKQLKERGVKVGVASSSKNCVPVLKKAKIHQLFDAIVDGVVSEKTQLKGKPAPDIFLRSLKMCFEDSDSVSPQESMMVEDAVSGVQAGASGNFGLVIGIDRMSGGNRKELEKNGATIVLDDLSEASISSLDDWFSKGNQGK
eukprot:TRINITY_DN7091_c0_g1_i1.p1 TRINITY_DN7091_c0_g1~~TRINITY_DN7091_c0_g1_i1.p1  ORF type:complete len:262 (+),score=95.20 TRINITY_DN7091_c0_g1_i1:188-973(+)